PYGLAMRSRSEGDRVDVVSGQRMATALRRIRRSVDQPAHPTVVTVASCDSGNVGDVVYTGASFAHELHEEGIPFVVASQFPLSKVGSVNMVDILYRRLLWGDDPREVLHVLRRELYALHTSTAHDWASLVTYCALPPDLPSQLSDTAYEQAKAAIDVALSACDRIVKELTEAGDDGREMSPATVEERLERLLDRADRAAARMPTTGEYETEGLGMLGSTEKRKAEVRFHFASCLAEHDAEYDASAQLSKCLAGLKASLAHYWDAVVQNMTEKKTPLKLKRSLHWVLTQHISLRAILGEEFERDFWIAAKLSAEIDLRDPNARVWGHGSLVELYALLLAFPDAGGVAGVEDPLSVAKEHGGMIVEIAGAGSFAVHSTRRQMERYVNWWCSDRFNDFLEREGIVRPAWGRDAGFIDAMKALVQVFPR
ncbi:MAG TPA: CHAT domain-containing protein, partial [Longimicrobiales bacterium]|nr:CHAT domain-containing protein [Longimicrobiales bacterium]